MGKVHAGQVRVSRESLAGWWERWLAARRPDLEDGSWQEYRRHGELRKLLALELADEARPLHLFAPGGPVGVETERNTLGQPRHQPSSWACFQDGSLPR